MPISRRPRLLPDPPGTQTPKTSARRHVVLAAVVSAGLLSAPTLPALAGGETREARPVTYADRTAVPQKACRPGDRPETGLQGRVPPTDVVTGRAAQGYTCNLRVVSRLAGTAHTTLDTYRDCAYYGQAPGAGGVAVVDISDAKNPRRTDTLVTNAMLDPWESLRVNAKRGLLVAAGEYRPSLDIYDIKTDCRRPRLLSSTLLLPTKGHEGWFSPDGMTYYASTTRTNEALGLVPTMFPIDISNPRAPRLLSSWTLDGQTHGGFTTEDGARTYVCQQEAPPKDALVTLGTRSVAARSKSPQPVIHSVTELGDNQWCQGAYRVTYNGRPYLIQYGERSGAPDCSRSDDGWATFGYPRIYDAANARRPKLVSTALLEVALPQHCEEVTGEGAANGLGYSVHHCSPDRLYDPTILACSYFHGGLRVLDIRNPAKPREIGYFNPGINGVVGTASRPVIRAERGEIWFTNDLAGLQVVKFKDGIWPFRTSARCPEFADHYFKQYNHRSTCRTASFRGIGRPAPAAPAFR